MRFIRKNGRVIPIDDKARGRRQAATAIGTGIAVAGASGVVAGIVHKDAAYTENAARAAASKAKKIGKRLEQGGPEMKNYFKFKAKMNTHFKTARKLGEETKALGKAGNRIRSGGALLGSALVAAGVHRALDDTRLKDSPTARATVSTAAGVASHFAIRSAYVKTLGSKGVSTLWAMRHAISRIAKKGFKL